MALLLRRRSNTIDELKRLLKIRKSENLMQMVPINCFPRRGRLFLLAHAAYRTLFTE